MEDFLKKSMAKFPDEFRTVDFMEESLKAFLKVFLKQFVDKFQKKFEKKKSSG